MAAAAPFLPMIVGAGVGAIANKKNPLAGALMGAVGGGVAGPAFSALSSGLSGAGAGIASGAAASGIPMGAQQAAMLGAQAEGFGGMGVAHALGSAGASPGMANAMGLATMGPQGLFSGANTNKLMGLGSQFLNSQQPQQAQQPQYQPMSPPRAISQEATIQPILSSTPTMRNARKRGIYG